MDQPHWFWKSSSGEFGKGKVRGRNRGLGLGRHFISHAVFTAARCHKTSGSEAHWMFQAWMFRANDKKWARQIWVTGWLQAPVMIEYRFWEGADSIHTGCEIQLAWYLNAVENIPIRFPYTEFSWNCEEAFSWGDDIVVSVQHQSSKTGNFTKEPKWYCSAEELQAWAHLRPSGFST